MDKERKVLFGGTEVPEKYIKLNKRFWVIVLITIIVVSIFVCARIILG